MSIKRKTLAVFCIAAAVTAGFAVNPALAQKAGPIHDEPPGVGHSSPGAWLSSPTMRSRRCAKTALRSGRKPCGPFSAATAAAWLIEQGFEVLCDCTLPIALISSAGPPA